MKKKNAIMISDTRPSLIGNLLVQLVETNEGLFDEAIIYYDKIDENDMYLMNKIMPCRFIHFQYDLPKEVKELPAFKKFSPLMFSRYFMFDLLKEYETVTWLDTDILICGKLDNIIKMAKIGGMSANFEDPKNKSYKQTDTVKTSFINPLNNYDMNKYNMSSGLITVSDNLPNFEKMTKWCFDKTIELANNLVLPDQGVLNILIQEFNINVKCVGENGAYCFYPTYKRDASKAKIVHSWGARKFWKSWYLYNQYPKWKEYYQKWIKMGGSDQIGEILPDISIVIPMYNPNIEFFGLVLEDLLKNQEQAHGFQYDNFELILVVDGEISEDFKNLLKEYNDPRIVLIHNKERAGIAKSLNIGIKSAKGKYIARIDDDDRINKHRLFKQKEYLENNKNIELVSSYFSYFGDLNDGRITLEGELCRAWSIFTCPFDHPTIMFRKDFFLKNNLLYDESRSHVEDWELWLRAFNKGMRVGVIPEILYYHRWYNGQAGQNTKTITMMRELVKKNFEKLDIKLTDDELIYISPWQGKVDNQKLERLNTIYNQALEKNKKLKLYDQDSLETVFSYRLTEAKTGVLTPMITVNDNNIDYNKKNMTNNVSILHRVRRRLLKPFYKPIKRIFYNITAEAVNDNITYNNHQIDKKIEKMTQSLKKDITEQQHSINLLHDNVYDFHQEFNTIYRNNITSQFFKEKIILIGTSEHGNIGDAAITLGAYEFIRNHFKDKELVEITTYEFTNKLPYLRAIINNDDLIFLQGGGNLGNKYIEEENVRRKTIESFPNNKIIILPQTIYFDDNGQSELIKTQEIYNRHKNLTIFTRGAISLSNANLYFKNAKSYEFLDCALNLNIDYSFERKGILCCIRDLDDESGFTENEYQKIFKIVKKLDSAFDFTTNTSKNDIPRVERFDEVYKQLTNFAKHKVIITDRLHGLIFALITNTPCIVLSSYNYKLKENCDMVKDNKMVTFIDKDIDLLETEISKYLNEDINGYKNDFSKNFKKMANIIKGTKTNK